MARRARVTGRPVPVFLDVRGGWQHGQFGRLEWCGDGRVGIGHYIAEGQINGRPVTFLVDTGATDVALPESMARALGLDFGPRVQVMTAAGPSSAWVTRLDEVSVGGIRRENVRATITGGEFNGILLGMSFLRHFDLQQSNGRLIIRETPGGN